MTEEINRENPELQPNIYNKEKKNLKIFNVFVLIVAMIFLAGVSFWLGIEKGKKSSGDFSEGPLPVGQTIILNKDQSKMHSIDFSLFWRVWDLLKEKYVDSESLDAKKLFYGAIKGMLAATGDPYTAFLDPAENKEFNEEIKGSFDGIGVEIGMKNNILTVIAPLEGMPAEKAGLRAGDKIIKINDTITSDVTIDEAVKQMRGPKGTEVRLTVLHDGADVTQELTIKRDTINVKSVKFEMKSDNIAYIKISRFGDDTYREFNSAVNQSLERKAKGLILDLRNDPGGYLDSSIDIASRMLPKGKVVVIEENQKKEQEKMYAGGGDVLSQLPTVVLINEGSASASEILAGALKDNRDNVTLVGKKSFGKGSVQEFVNLSDGTAVKITVAKWLTPKGDQINEKGINPDVEVELSDDDYENDKDPQLDKALEVIKEKIK